MPQAAHIGAWQLTHLVMIAFEQNWHFPVRFLSCKSTLTALPRSSQHHNVLVSAS
jgi:phosphate starvation-inducible membrane PsiE